MKDNSSYDQAGGLYKNWPSIVVFSLLVGLVVGHILTPLLFSIGNDTKWAVASFAAVAFGLINIRSWLKKL